MEIFDRLMQKVERKNEINCLCLRVVVEVVVTAGVVVVVVVAARTNQSKRFTFKQKTVCEFT
jgi:hypothetical protein